jgi:hypothetical protein
VKSYVWILAVYGAGEDQLDRLCEKWSITQSKWEREYPTCNTKKDG